MLFLSILQIFLCIVLGKGILTSSAQDTSDACLFFDKLFDSVNGNSHKIVDGKIYRSALKKGSPHHKFWEDALKILNSMVFVDPVTKKKSSTLQPRSIQNWIKTIKGIHVYIFQSRQVILFL